MTYRLFRLIAILSFLAGFSMPAQPLSPSKLSAHLINAYTPGSSNIVSGQPRVLKILALDSGFPAGMIAAMRDYKLKAPAGKIVVRVYSPKTYTLADDVSLSAGDFWTNILRQSLNAIAPADRALIDYLEGPNEGQTPTLGYPFNAALQASQWFNQFWTNLIPFIVSAGYKPCIGSIAVGNPGGSVGEMNSYLAAFVPALRQAQTAGGAWSYHAYTIGYTTDPAAEFYYSLRYRQFYDYFRVAFPDLMNMPLILTEGGVDFSGDPSTSGWQARGTSAYYERWLNWFDARMQEDSYVLGCTLFQNGDPAGWSSFDLEPIAGWMKNYLLGPSALPAPPSGLTAVAGNGSITLVWTNVPDVPTTYSVKRSTNASGPWFTIAAGISAGIQNYTYTDASVSNFAAYYYVVTAVNRLGESQNSSIVQANPIAPILGAMNCGGSSAGAFVPDQYYDAGLAFSVTNNTQTNGLMNPAPQAVYQSQRYGNLTYTIPYLNPSSSYLVRLHFAEIYWTAPGQRVFNVYLNDSPVLTNLDIFAESGGSFRGVIKEFYTASDAAGRVRLRLETLIDNAALNGIEIIPVLPTAVPSAPVNLRATVGNAVVDLAWTAPSGASGFYVKRAAVSGGPYTVIASRLPGAAYRDVSFVPNTTYYYVVTATNNLGESLPSAEVGARPTNGLPDVVVTAVNWSPAMVLSNSHVVFNARVLNRGSASTPAGTVIGVAFQVDSGSVTWSANYSAALSPNATLVLGASGGPFGSNYWTASSGPHSLRAIVDDVNRFAESEEGNNVFSTNMAVYSPGYALNSGGAAVSNFAADSHYAGSANTFSVTNVIDSTGVATPAPPGVYQSERWGEFAYVFDDLVPGSNYLVRLHFAEISPSVNQVGDRRFSVSINEATALKDFDIFAAAGGKFKAVTRDIRKRADAAGSLMIYFNRGASNEPKCSGIEILADNLAPIPPFITTLSASNTIAWTSQAGRLYQVQRNADLNLTNWEILGETILSSGGLTTLSIPVTNAQSYFRIKRVE